MWWTWPPIILHPYPGHCHHALLFLLSCLLLFHRERHTPCMSGLSLHSWNIFYFFERILKEKNLIKSCNRTMLLQGNVTQLTTILTRSKLINLLPWNPYLYYHRFLSFLRCLHTAAFFVIEIKYSLYMSMYWKPLQWAFKGFFIWSILNFNFFVNSLK